LACPHVVRVPHRACTIRERQRRRSPYPWWRAKREAAHVSHEKGIRPRERERGRAQSRSIGEFLAPPPPKDFPILSSLHFGLCDEARTREREEGKKETHIKKKRGARRTSTKVAHRSTPTHLGVDTLPLPRRARRFSTGGGAFRRCADRRAHIALLEEKQRNNRVCISRARRPVFRLPFRFYSPLLKTDSDPPLSGCRKVERGFPKKPFFGRGRRAQMGITITKGDNDENDKGDGEKGTDHRGSSDATRGSVEGGGDGGATRRPMRCR
jgi:hypothetical protein